MILYLFALFVHLFIYMKSQCKCIHLVCVQSNVNINTKIFDNEAGDGVGKKKKIKLKHHVNTVHATDRRDIAIGRVNELRMIWCYRYRAHLNELKRKCEIETWGTQHK